MQRIIGHQRKGVSKGCACHRQMKFHGFRDSLLPCSGPMQIEAFIIPQNSIVSLLRAFDNLVQIIEVSGCLSPELVPHLHPIVPILDSLLRLLVRGIDGCSLLQHTHRGQISTLNKQVFLYCVNYSIRPLSALNLLLAYLIAPSHLEA